MTALFSKNAYNVLGLDSGASQKEISRRAKEIVNLLKIDEVSEYDTDLNVSGMVRSEASVKDALQKLSSPTKRISEYFFWFEIENEQDEKALALLQKESYDDALALWQSQSSKSLTAKKNLAIASSVLLSATGLKKYLTLSLETWEDIIKSDKFWMHFEKVYALNDEVGTSKSALEKFRGETVDYLSDFYTDISQMKKDNSFYALFSKTFGVKGQKLQNDVIAPIFEKINDTSQKLHKLNISEDNIISPQEVMTLKRLVNKLRDCFQELKDLGLYEDTQSKVMRDKAAEAIRAVAVDLFINLSETSKSVALLKVAMSISGTPSLISKLKKDITDAQQLISQEQIIKPINDLLGEEKYSNALVLILEGKEEHKKDKQLQEYFDKRIQWCVTAIASEHFVESKKIFEKENYSEAAPRFKYVYEFIEQHLEVFDFNHEALQNVLSELRDMMATAKPDLMQHVDTYRQSVIDKTGDVFKDQFEQTILIILLDSIIYGRLAEMMPALKKKNHNQKIKNVLWWVAIIVFFLIIGGVFNGNSGSSSNSSGSSSCSTELESIKSELDSVESLMDRYKQSDLTEAFNEQVPKQNELANQYNAKLAECK